MNISTTEEIYDAPNTLEVRDLSSFLSGMEYELLEIQLHEEKTQRKITSFEKEVKGRAKELQKLKTKSKDVNKELEVKTEELETVENELASFKKSETDWKNEISDLENQCVRLEKFRINPVDAEKLERKSLILDAYKNLLGCKLSKNISDAVFEGVFFNLSNDYLKLLELDLKNLTKEEIKTRLWSEIEKGCNKEKIAEIKELLAEEKENVETNITNKM